VFSLHEFLFLTMDSVEAQSAVNVKKITHKTKDIQDAKTIQSSKQEENENI